jgi:predicted Zn-dependent peptidase
VSAADDVSLTVLPSGMKVIIREGRSINLAAVDIWVKAGSVNETAETNGVSHFVEHMIFKATQKYAPGQIDREIEGLGAELNGGTSRDYVHFYTTVASEYLSAALDALADAIMNAQFRPEDVEKERRVILDEIARAESNPMRRAAALFAQAAFKSHPYRLPPTGTRESISKLTRDDLVNYYQARFTPANTCVSIAGEVSKADALEVAQKAFSGFERIGPTAADPQPEPARVSAVSARFRLPSKQAYVILGYPAPPASELRDSCALDVILAVLGDTNRGRIAAALTQQGLRFSEITAEFTAQRYPTTFSITVAVDPQDIDKAISVLVSEFRALAKNPAAAEELARAKRLVEGSDLFEQETFSGQARSLGLYESIASYDLALKYGGTVRSLTAEDVMSAASRYFGADNYCLVILEPEQK